MTLDEECRLSYFKEIAVLDRDHHVILVQHAESGKIYVKKELEVFDAEVMRHLRDHHVRHTPVIYEAVEDGNRMILIEEYISGQTLKELQDMRGTFPEEEVRWYASAVCGILAELHSQVPPVIHRDIKPSNIMITPEGVPVLLDMNAAKRYREAGRDTQLIGTQGYAAPEQYGFGASDVRTDIYSMGVLMNVLLTGHFPNEQRAEGLLGPIIGRCLRMNPEERFSSAGELLAALSGTAPARPGMSLESYGEVKSAPAPFHDTPAEKYSGWRRYLPPGFRSGRIWVMALSLLGYLMLFSIAKDYKPSAPGMDNRLLWQCAMVASVLLPVFFTADYCGIQEKLHINGIKNPTLRWLAIALADVLLFWLVVIFCALVEG